ncbi:MAG: DUF2958 domain-containing protein [Dehalococcoidia bacterium]
MPLLPAEIARAAPCIGATSEQIDPMVWAKFFYPDFGWTWFVIETDGEDECFGLVDGHDRELGYFSLRELERVWGPLGRAVERDLYFVPCRLSELG